MALNARYLRPVALLSVLLGFVALGLPRSSAEPTATEQQIKAFLDAVRECQGTATLHISPKEVSGEVYLLTPKKGVTDLELAKIFTSGVPLSAVYLKSMTLGEASTAALRGHATTLEEVSLSEVHLSDDIARILSQCQKLHSLSVYHRAISAEAIQLISRVSQLRTLKLTSLSLSDLSLAPLRSLIFLENLGLAFSDLPDDCSFLAALQSLETLDLDKVRAASAHLRHLKSLPSLRVLKLAETNLTAESLASLSEAGIRELELSGTTVTPEIGKQLRKWPALRRLAVSHSTLRPGTIAEICGCAGLEILNLGYPQKADQDEQDTFLPLPRLTNLNVSGFRLSEKVLSNLVKCKNLEVLTLRRTDCTDERLQRLQPLTNLTSVTLAQTEVTDRSLATCQEWRRLRALSVPDTRMTAEGVRQFLKARPWVTVDHKSEMQP